MSCLYSVVAVGKETIPTDCSLLKTVASWKVGFCVETRAEARSGLEAEKASFNEVGTQVPSTPVLSHSLHPGRLLPGAQEQRKGLVCIPTDLWQENSSALPSFIGDS